MPPAEDLFIYACVLIDDLIAVGAIAIPPRPGPAPACSPAELLALALGRHLLGRRSQSGFLGSPRESWRPFQRTRGDSVNAASQRTKIGT
jgi:hypothetical protein